MNQPRHTGPAPTEPVARWSHFHHDADIGIRGQGADLATALEQAALAMTAVICDPETVRPSVAVDIRVDGPDEALLLVNWIDALVFEMATRRMLFSRFDVSVSGLVLEARAWGEPIDVERHQPAVEVKGATLTALSIRRTSSGRVVAECVIDV